VAEFEKSPKVGFIIRKNSPKAVKGQDNVKDFFLPLSKRWAFFRRHGVKLIKMFQEIHLDITCSILNKHKYYPNLKLY
jgi:hypothetical protein